MDSTSVNTQMTIENLYYLIKSFEDDTNTVYSLPEPSENTNDNIADSDSLR